jgi:hypothetical protein
MEVVDNYHALLLKLKALRRKPEIPHPIAVKLL